NGGAATTMLLSQNHADAISLPAGAVTWSVEAVVSNCPSLISTTSTFTIVPPPPPCTTPATTTMRSPANVSSGGDYTVAWDPIAGVIAYELQESSSSDFAANFITLTATEQAFKH